LQNQFPDPSGDEIPNHPATCKAATSGRAGAPPRSGTRTGAARALAPHAHWRRTRAGAARAPPRHAHWRRTRAGATAGRGFTWV